MKDPQRDPVASVPGEVGHWADWRLDEDQGALLARRYFDLFLALFGVILILAVVQPSLFANPSGVLVVVGTLWIGVLLARIATQRGKTQPAMRAYAGVMVVAVTVLWLTSPRLGVPATMAVSFLPVFAAVCGLRAAIKLGALLYAGAILSLAGSLMGLPLPELFPGRPVGLLIVTAIGFIAVLLPVPILLRQIGLSLRHMRSEQQRMKDFSVAANDWFWETDAQHRFIYMSLPADEQQHRLAQLALGKTRWELAGVPDPTADPVWAAHARLMDTHVPFRDFVFSVRNANGDLSWISVAGKPVLGEDGSFKGYRGSASDVTWRRAKEREIEAAREAAREAAEAANRAKSEFLAAMSHEIRTPMNGIVGMTSMLMETPLTAEQRDHLGIVEQSAHSLLAIINDILDLSKIESGQMDLESIPFDLPHLLRSTLRTLEFSARAKKLDLHEELADSVPHWLRGDPTRLRQILLNLLSNAVKFTAQGSVVVRIDAQPAAAGRVRLHLQVRDTGIGIPEDKLQSIFEPFTQADSSVTRKFGGTGLGLTICRKLVTMMGGRIWVESELGQGSRFQVELELPVAEPPAEAPQSSGDGPQTRSLQVLLVEDNPINQLLAIKLLEHAGHRVTVAGNGQEAIDRWKELKPQVILMDVQMPIVDGLEATRRIRQAEREQQLGHVPIVAMTANAFAEDRKACLDAGMDAYLAKPVKLDVLVRALAEVVPAEQP